MDAHNDGFVGKKVFSFNYGYFGYPALQFQEGIFCCRFLCSLIVRDVFVRMTGDSESFTLKWLYGFRDLHEIKFDQSFFEGPYQ